MAVTAADLELDGIRADKRQTVASSRSGARNGQQADAFASSPGKDKSVRIASFKQAGVCLVFVGLVTACGSAQVSGAASNVAPSDPAVRAAKALVEASLTAAPGFPPPAGVPKAQAPGATIAFVAADVSNGGINA